jgi:hypothetical protein
MHLTWVLLLALAAICLGDAGVLDYVEPVLGTPVVATSAEYVAGVLGERGWTQIETDGERVSAVYVGDGRDEDLAFTFTPPASMPDEIHQDILTVDYTYVPWLEREGAVERARAEFERLVGAFDYLIGPGGTETTDAHLVHTWPGREASRVELVLAPMWAAKLTVKVDLVPLREPEGD